VVDTHSTAARQAGTASRVYVDFHNEKRSNTVTTVIWIIAVIIGIFGVLRLIRGDILWGILLIVLAFVVGPGGYSIFK
jgi:TM2 domain-containing membrane protein YozV